DPGRDTDRLVEVADRDDCGRGPEDLLLRDPHLRVDVGEDGRPVEEALAEVAVARDLSAGEELRALVLADRGVRVDLLERGAVDDRADVGVVLPARPEPQLLDALDELLLELVVRAFLHDHARRGGAALARGAERRPGE